MNVVVQLSDGHSIMAAVHTDDSTDDWFLAVAPGTVRGGGRNGLYPSRRRHVRSTTSRRRVPASNAPPTSVSNVGIVNWGVEVQRLIADAVPESRSLEYKQEIDLKSRPGKAKCLKQLTGMANGGGGTVIYGIVEDRSSGKHSVPGAILPCTDAQTSTRLRDLVRDAVFPPLQLDVHEVQTEGGFVLVCEVFPTALGPYMVEMGDNRYYTRTGTSTVAMSETQVRNAYLLAERGASQRDTVWQERGMPLRVPHDPWLSVSAVPHAPLVPRFRAVAADRHTFSMPASIRHAVALTGITDTHEQLARWANGMFAYAGPNASDPPVALRIHEDGAIACGRRLPANPTMLDIQTLVNGQLVWIGWVLSTLAIPTVVEVEIRLDRVSQVELANVVDGVVQTRRAHQPVGLSVVDVVERSEHRPGHLSLATVRHSLVRALSDRVAGAFGLAERRIGFETGELFSSDGHPTGMAVAGARLYGTTRAPVSLYADGALVVAHNNELVGHLANGALLDPEGHTLAVTEWATGDGCPNDFLPQAERTSHDELFPPGPLGAAIEMRHPTERPQATGRWSATTLMSRLVDVASRSLHQ